MRFAHAGSMVTWRPAVRLVRLDRMILSDETSEDGERRIYFTQAASVVSYFTEDEGGGVQAHVHPAEFACPWNSPPEKLIAVRDAMLEETAQRLNIRTDQVMLMTGKR
jgi:hypothetical protein